MRPSIRFSRTTMNHPNVRLKIFFFVVVVMTSTWRQCTLLRAFAFSSKSCRRRQYYGSRLFLPVLPREEGKHNNFIDMHISTKFSSRSTTKNAMSLFMSSSSSSPQDQNESQDPSRLKQKENEQPQAQSRTSSLFPVLHRIAGQNWTGSYRYVQSGDHEHKSVVKRQLTGGMRYDILGNIVTLSSFLIFPDGTPRHFIMQGVRPRDNDEQESDGSSSSSSAAAEVSSPLLLMAAKEEDGGVPTGIYMLLTELVPDTILLQEVEAATGRAIMAGTLSITKQDEKDDDGGLSLIQISQELGHDEGGQATIKGHQIWRLTREP